jgi:hypothetical protein
MARPSAPLVWDDERPYWMQEPTVSSRRRRFAIVGVILVAGMAGLFAWAPWSSPPAAAPPPPMAAPVVAIAPPPPPAEPAVTPPQPVPVEPLAPASPPAPATEHRQLAGGRLHFAPPTAIGGGLVARWIRIGSRLAKHGQFRSALAAFQRAAGLEVHNADAWYGMALCDYELHRNEAAARAANQAIWADPEHAMGNLLVGFLRQEAGHAAEARQFYDRYLAREPNGPYADELVSVLDQLPKSN